MDFVMIRWEEFPQLALYMDQVLLVLNQALSPLEPTGAPLVTSTMINNYVKLKLAAPAEKKKYGREHMARFVMICLLKKVLSMAEIGQVLELLLQERTLEEAYALFCRELELRLREPSGPDGPGCPPVLSAAIRAAANKIVVEQLLVQAFPPVREEEKKTRKDRPTP